MQEDDDHELLHLLQHREPKANNNNNNTTTSSFSSLSSSTVSSSSSGIFQTRQLLFRCAELISQSDFSSAERLLSILTSSPNYYSNSPSGDSTERLAYQFVRALSIRFHRQYAVAASSSSSSFRSSSASTGWMLINLNNDQTSIANNYLNPLSPPPPVPRLHPPHHGFAASAAATTNPTTTTTTTTTTPTSNVMRSTSNRTAYDRRKLEEDEEAAEEEEEEIQVEEAEEEGVESCYLSLNQITPFIRFSHLTANQAILEAIDVTHASIHIIDFNIMHGVQWPPFMQALLERSSLSNSPPPTLRITGSGPDFNFLQRTGDRLSTFAQSLGLRFQFHPLLLLGNDDPTSSLSQCLIDPHEALAVNCVLYLHTLLKDHDSRDLSLFLHKVKALKPKVVTLAETEASHNHPLFLQRFAEALDHYSAIFESLEVTVPPKSRERMAVEKVWFGKEIEDIVAGEGEGRRKRHERYEWWEMMMRSTGFTCVAPSAFAVSQAKLLLRLHYPSEGYRLHILNNTFFLGWKNRPLFSVASWH